MTAAQAKELSRNTLSSIPTGPIMQAIKQQIGIAAHRGEFSTTFDIYAKLRGTQFAASSNIIPVIVNALRRDGFKVDCQNDQRDGGYYNISWKD